MSAVAHYLLAGCQPMQQRAAHGRQCLSRTGEAEPLARRRRWVILPRLIVGLIGRRRVGVGRQRADALLRGVWQHTAQPCFAWRTSGSQAAALQQLTGGCEP